MSILLKTSLLFYLFSFVWIGTIRAEVSDLYVYYPALSSAVERQRALLQDPQLKGKNVLVFEKFNEFESANKRRPASMILVASEFLRETDDYRPVAQLLKDGRETYRFLAVTVDKKVSLQNIEQHTVGIVDTLGRKGTSALATSLLGGKKPKRVKRVSKMENLFPLLAVEMADLILVPGDFLEPIKKDFRAETTVLSESDPVNFPVLCVRKNIRESDADFLRALKDSTIKALGFSNVRWLRGTGND